MSAPVLLLVAWLAGSTFGLASRPERVETAQVGVLSALFFGAGAIAPTGVVLFMLFPDWSLMYAAHPEHAVPGVVLGVLVLGYVSVPVLGCLAARGLAAAGGRGGPAALVFGSVLLLGAATGVGWERLTTVAYYEAFHYGGARVALTRSTLFVPLVLSGAVMAGVYVFSVLHLRRQL